MKKKIRLLGFVFWTTCLLLAGCQTGNQGGETNLPATLTPVLTNTPVPTSVQETTKVPESTLIPTNTTTPSPKPTATSMPTPSPTSAPMSCRVDGETLVFSGNGVLTYDVVEVLFQEYEGIQEKSFRRLVIEEGITEIGAEAFDGGFSFESIEFPCSLKRIGAAAFSEDESLKKISFKEGTVQIGVEAFCYCESLIDVDLPTSLEVIGAYAFEGTAWLIEKQRENSTVKVNNVLLVTRDLSNDSILEEIEYTTKFSLQEEWLNKYENEQGLVVINDILISGEKAEGEVVIPDGVRYIADGAFMRGEKITKVILPDSVVYIGDYAFSNCINLETVELSEMISYIGASAFQYCSTLKKVEIPERVKTIAYGAFEGCIEMESVKLPAQIDSMGEGAFYGCAKLKEITFPEGMSYIPSSCFEGCISLSQIVLPETVNWIGSSAFSRCAALEKVTLPKNLRSIDGYAFYRTGLKEILMPEGVEKIGNSVFRSCEVLVKVEIPVSLEEIGDLAFCGTKWYEDLKRSNEMILVNNILLIGNSFQEEVVVPEGVTIISGEAFKDGVVKKVTMPDSVMSIGEAAFEGCTELAEITFSKNLQYIGKDAFLGCTSLETVILPEKVKELEVAAFEACINLKSIDLPDELERIGSDAFRDCTSLQQIELPEKITMIEYGVFYGCSSLKSVKVPQGVTYIGPDAFKGCEELVSVAIPISVNEIWDDDVFKNCPLVALYCVSGSYAAQYARENDMWCVPVSEGFWTNGEELPKTPLSLREKIEISGGVVNVGGEECNVVWGKSGALAWKYVEATFDQRAYYATAFAMDISESSLAYTTTWDAMRVFNWYKWYGWDEFNIEHIGDDMFLFTGTAYGVKTYYYINGSDGLVFEEDSWLTNKADRFSRCTEYNDGYAIGIYYDRYSGSFGYVYSNDYLAKLDAKGNLTVSDESAYISENSNIGKYSEGVFYYNHRFYDIDFNVVIDLHDKDWGGIYSKRGVYTPCFIDGVCTLITSKNGKYWIFDINKQGEMITEAKEFDLALLNY